MAVPAIVWYSPLRKIPGDSPETLQKLCLSTKFPYQEIRWNYGIFRCAHLLLSSMQGSTKSCNSLSSELKLIVFLEIHPVFSKLWENLILVLNMYVTCKGNSIVKVKFGLSPQISFLETWRVFFFFFWIVKYNHQLHIL